MSDLTPRSSSRRHGTPAELRAQLEALGVIRVYIGPEPRGAGPHPGFRGVGAAIQLEPVGVIATAKAEYIGGHDDAEWEPNECRCLVPWHRVHSVEFDDGCAA